MRPTRFSRGFLHLLLLGLAALTACAGGLPAHCDGLPANTPPADRNVLGCSPEVSIPDDLPYQAWELRFAHPPYMEIWIENSQVLDIDNRLLPRAGGGTISFGDLGDVDAAGWLNASGNPPYGAGRALTGLNVPQKIYVRWQSRVEPQTYKALFNFPAWAREKMVIAEAARCPGQKATEQQYRDIITLGLAPGGTVKVWLRGVCLDAIEVMTVQADIEPKGPSTTDGKHKPLSEPARLYVEKHGIPYESWK
ncbi:MAG: hypothetical protein CMN28_03775 [Salinisphaeraceae bacterium]|nr:hypothetical protein [Salinisphaeraceae bacterium]